jgi:hypothetical protein
MTAATARKPAHPPDLPHLAGLMDGAPAPAPWAHGHSTDRRRLLADTLPRWPRVVFAAECARVVLPLFERRHPADTRPALAIDAAIGRAMGTATKAAATAAYAADAADAAYAAAAAAAYAAYAAADAADAAAADAAYAAADAAADAAYAADADAAYAAADAAADAADAAYAADADAAYAAADAAAYAAYAADAADAAYADAYADAAAADAARNAQWRWTHRAYLGAVCPVWAPEWNTRDVVALARGIFADLAFDRMPILADALNDAGCDHWHLTDRLRNPDGVFTRADCCLWKPLGLDRGED